MAAPDDPLQAVAAGHDPEAHLALGQAEALRPELFLLGDQFPPLHVLEGTTELGVPDHLGEGGGARALGVELWPEAAGLRPGREVRQHSG
eukprot:15223043-Alexandrium_andersonii.AAC.1